MPGAKRNQAKKTSEAVNGVKMNPTREEVEDLMGSVFAGLVVHLNGLEKGWDTAKMMEFKRFVIDELKQATEPEGWEHNGSVGFAVATLKCECEKNKIISITDGVEHDTGVVVQFICRNVPREETRFNLRIVEARLKKKFGDEFNLCAGTKCGNCEEVHPFPHVLGIQDGALWKQSQELKELKKENEDMKSRVIDYEYILKENEELKEGLTEWKEAHESLQARHEEWITTTLEENEGFLGEVRKCGWKDGMEEESARTIQVEMKLKELKEEYQELIEDFAKLEEERHTLVERIHELEAGCAEWSMVNEDLERENDRLRANQKKPRTRKPKAEKVPVKVLVDAPPAPEINAAGERRFHVVAAGGGAAAEESVCADKPEE